MRGILFSLGFLLLTLPLVAQVANIDVPVFVCVVSGECIGPSCVSRHIVFPERELLVKKLNSSTGIPKFQARDEGYRDSLGCSDREVRSCDYMVAVTPVEVHRTVPTPPSKLEAQRLLPVQPSFYPPQSPAAQHAEEQQQQPLDQSSIRFELYRVRSCERVVAKQISNLESVNSQPTDVSRESLTSKAAEELRKAVANDLKRGPKGLKPKKT